MFDNSFSDREIARRLEALRTRLDERNLAAAVIAAPENVFYLTGLDHWGYFAPQGMRASDVYGAWQEVVDEAGLPDYRRHHCGYAVGIGCPPSWTGGNTVVGLRPDSDLEIRQGMTFHILSWLMETGRGDGFVSNTVLVGPGGAEVLTATTGGPPL